MGSELRAGPPRSRRRTRDARRDSGSHASALPERAERKDRGVVNREDDATRPRTAPCRVDVRRKDRFQRHVRVAEEPVGGLELPLVEQLREAAIRRFQQLLTKPK